MPYNIHIYGPEGQFKPHMDTPEKISLERVLSVSAIPQNRATISSLPAQRALGHPLSTGSRFILIFRMRLRVSSLATAQLLLSKSVAMTLRQKRL